MNENFAIFLKSVHATNESFIGNVDDNWSMDLLNLVDFDPKNIKGHRYFFNSI